MKKAIYLAMSAACLCSLMSCSDNDGGNLPADETKYINIETKLANMSRVSDSGTECTFENGDQISVYAWTGSATSITTPLVVNGVVNTLSGTTWTPASPMLWSDQTTKHYFMSVYPAHTVTNFTADSYTLDPSKQSEADLLVALNTTGIAATSTPVTLDFSHMMAKLVVNLKFRNQWASTPTVSKVVAKAANTATINYIEKSVTAGAVSTVEIPQYATVASGYSLAFSGIMVPQTGFKTIVITIDSTDYTFTNTDDITVASGKITTLNLIVGRDKIELGNVTIGDWSDGGSINGSAY